MTRTRIGLTLGTAVFGVTALVGLAACGPGPATGSRAAAVAAPAEASLLAAMGFDTGVRPVADPVADSPTPSAGPTTGPSAAPKAARKRALARQLLRRNTLHGSFVMKTKDGTRTVDVQRGTVTAIDDRTVSVKSTDDFALTWTFGSPIHVLEHRTSVQPSAVKVGTEIGVAGARNGSTTTASLMVIR